MFAQIEDEIIARCKRVVGQHVRTIEDLPGNWDEQTLKAARRNVPGIYIAWSGGRGLPGSRASMTSRYAVYVVTGQASGERERRRGNNRQVGAYELLERIVPAVHGLAVKDVGTLQLEQVDNLYSDRADQQGIVIYGAVYTLKTPFPAPLDANDLADFETYHANSRVPDGPDIETHLTLPSGEEHP
ncbi:phage protein Gp37 [Pseudomonas segetis]|uniref:Mu-like prophage protein gp37 n=1 Tax=Pseudomonas segetis TaxID=298908 RepID=A0A239JQN5_9PSED|nr:phage protein Gp37 [Pseudomonas segetis]SNT07673.1 Mu-like prophage protein gp37 [Pseudomonas segetis]